MSDGRNASPPRTDAPSSLTFLLDSSPRASRVLRDSLSQSFTFPNPPPPADQQQYRQHRSVRDSRATGRSEYTEFELTDTESLAAPSEYATSDQHRQSGRQASFSSSSFVSDSSSQHRGSISSSVYSYQSSITPTPQPPNSRGRPVLPPLPQSRITTNGRGDLLRPSASSSLKQDPSSLTDDHDHHHHHHHHHQQPTGKPRPIQLSSVHSRSGNHANDEPSSPYLRTFLEQKTPTSATFPAATAPFISRANTAPVLETLSTSASMSNMRQYKLDAAPRDVSIDSVASSLSSSVSPTQTTTTNSLSQTSQQEDAKDILSLDPAKLIASAGSPEAAILKLLKEKHAAIARSNQLWKLVEQQREMILNLNRDLKRLVRKKNNNEDTPASPGMPPTPTLDLRESGSGLSKHHSSSSSSKKGYAIAQNLQASPDSGVAVSHKRQSLDSTSTSVTTVSSPTLLKFSRPDSSGHGNIANSQLTPTLSPTDSVYSSGYPTPREFALRTSNPTDSSSIRKASIASAQDTKRKAPPKPLNLGAQPQVTQTPALASRHSDSEIEDGIVDDDEEDGDSDDDDDDIYAGIPKFERGRQKTRQDDDRQREAIALIEERSRSKKDKKSRSKGKSKSKSKQVGEASSLSQDQQRQEGEEAAAAAAAIPVSHPATVVEAPAGFTAGPGLPSSPRGAMLGGLQSPLQQNVGSISAMLGARLYQGSSAPRQTDVMALPLKSPGLPMSPRPSDRPMNAPTPRLPKQNPLSPGPLSPRPLGANGMPLSPRAPRQPIPVPTSHMLAINSPHLARAEAYGTQGLQATSNNSLAERLQTRATADTRQESMTETAPHEGQIYRGFASEKYPDLLLPPNALPKIDISVHSSRLRPSRHATEKADEDAIITLAVDKRPEQQRLWRVEKSLAAMLALDQAIKAACDFRARLPERSLFKTDEPAKMDTRRTELNKYFEEMLETPMKDKTGLVICEFVSTDVIGAFVEAASLQSAAAAAATTTATATELNAGNARHRTMSRRKKQGYLSKRGKQFGGWKSRYFILDGTDLQYFESQGGAHLGKIRMQNAQIARQTNHVSPEEQSEYRHAFIIFEPKRRDSSNLVRHVLCAESDEERDAWVDALLPYIDTDDAIEAALSSMRPAGSAESPLKSTASKANSKGSLHTRPSTASELQNNNIKSMQAIGYEDTVLGDAPIIQSPSPASAGLNREDSWPTDDGGDNSNDDGDERSDSRAKNFNAASSSGMIISGPIALGPIQNLQAWGNRSPTASKDGRDGSSSNVRKKSLFGFRSRGSDEDARRPGSSGIRGANGNSSVPRTIPLRSRPTMPVFGMSLTDAAENMAPHDVDIYLPAPVYRCIEYLEAKNAAKEEGIFRLSGSSVVIKALKERFNNEGDVLLLNEEHYDVHAIASLLKLYLRELPEIILTREVHLDFLRVLELEDKSDKLTAINALVKRLPEANYELLASLSHYLIDVVTNADYNKMNVRNVGIVFAPTLNIPAPLISYFITDYDAIFNDSGDASTSPIMQKFDNAPSPISLASSSSTTPTSGGIPDLRSPRKQMFTDLPTPAYNQTSFQQSLSGGNGSYANTNGSGAPQDRRFEHYTSSATSESRNGNFSRTEQQTQPSITPFYRYHQPLMTQVPDQSGFSSLNAVLAPTSPPSTVLGSSSTLASQSSTTLVPSLSTSSSGHSNNKSNSTVPSINTNTSAAASSSSSSLASSLASPKGNGKTANPSSMSSVVSQTTGTGESRRKSSYQRLREMTGAASSASSSISSKD